MEAWQGAALIIGALAGREGLAALLRTWHRERGRTARQEIESLWSSLRYTRQHYEAVLRQSEARCRQELQRLESKIEALEAKIEALDKE